MLVLLTVFQRQQVILTERWASQHKEIHFSSMHPGWADTPGKALPLRLYRHSNPLDCFVFSSSSPEEFHKQILVNQQENIFHSLLCDGFVFPRVAVQSSMPSFHAKMQSKLRTEAMGADTVVWLAVSPAAVKLPSGQFFQGEKSLVFPNQLWSICECESLLL